MKKSIGLTMAMFAALAATTERRSMWDDSPERGTNDGSYGHGIPDQPKKVIPKGCKEYRFFGITVYALSEGRAYKKANRILLKNRQKRKEPVTSDAPAQSSN